MFRAATVLKQASANATEAATEDQASDHSHQTKPRRASFQLDITEDLPTADQMQTILEYVGKNKISSVINGTSTVREALKKFKENVDNLQRPLIVDWNNGRALVSDKESEILKMLGQSNQK
ncbi:hypothetical protein RRF57_012596 [Xylaria bambusicola]|uniref:Uncharacterized protein n=1 Tax=Xylaria bambusicola TaxID=326684 RepID=A0AAN7V4C5_9PEZI